MDLWTFLKGKMEAEMGDSSSPQAAAGARLRERVHAGTEPRSPLRKVVAARTQPSP